MVKWTIVLVAGLVPMVPATVFFLRRCLAPASAARGLVLGLNGFNVILGLLAVGLGVVWLASPTTVLAASSDVFGGRPLGSGTTS